MEKSPEVITCCLTPVGPGGVCHIHAEGRDIITAGRVSVCLRASRKVRSVEKSMFIQDPTK